MLMGVIPCRIFREQNFKWPGRLGCHKALVFDPKTPAFLMTQELSHATKRVWARQGFSALQPGARGATHGEAEHVAEGRGRGIAEGEGGGGDALAGPQPFQGQEEAQSVAPVPQAEPG